MNLKFWKRKTNTEDSEPDSQQADGGKTASRKSSGHAPRHRETSENTHSETVDPLASHPNRRLIIGAAGGGLIVAVIGLITWKIFLPSPEHTTVTADTPTSIQSNPFPEKQLNKSSLIEFLKLRKAQSRDHQTDIEALKKKYIELQAQIKALKIEPSLAENPPSLSRQAEIEILKKNNELQAQIEAPKKNHQQHAAASAANQAEDKVQPPPLGGDMAIGNKNPKATAMTLKEAIDAMNANTRNPPAKAAK